MHAYGPRLCVFVCETFRDDVAAAVRAEGWPDVDVAGFPTRCGQPPLQWAEVAEALPEGCTQILLVGRSCLAQQGAPLPELPPITQLHLENCFDLIAPASMVREWIRDGVWMMSPFWLKNWRARIGAMGFDAESSGEFYRSFASRLLLLDTGSVGDLSPELAAFSAAVSLPAERAGVGLDVARQRLKAAVLEWHLQVAEAQAQTTIRELSTERADSLAAVDLLARLAEALSESDVVRTVEEMYRMLFAPEVFHFLTVAEDGTVEAPGLSPELLHLAQNLQEPYAWTPAGDGFLICLNRGSEKLAVVLADRLAFPQYKERYLSLALTAAGISALALENARTRSRLAQAEKMASLGVLVAGVAHEINTPVGVCLTAITTLEAQANRLAGLFATRAMKQSDLSEYLKTAEHGSQLILKNLDRIIRLMDSFRRIAVEKQPPVKKRFVLRRLVESVIAEFREANDAVAPEVRIECDPELIMNSFAGDLASILSNLYSNSLHHGFKDRPGGHVWIEAHSNGSEIVLDYRDDGAGLSDEARQKIFDPFFTTDMQKGMGLGMHLVYNLVKFRFGGSITLQDAACGVHFRIRLPIAEKGAAV